MLEDNTIRPTIPKPMVKNDEDRAPEMSYAVIAMTKTTGNEAIHKASAKGVINDKTKGQAAPPDKGHKSGPQMTSEISGQRLTQRLVQQSVAVRTRPRPQEAEAKRDGSYILAK